MTLDASVSGASSCTLMVKPAVSGLPLVSNCTGGTVSFSVNLPPNGNKRSTKYRFVLVATGSRSVKSSPVIVDVEGAIPSITGLSSTPPTVESAGGTAVLGANVFRGKSCTLSVTPSLSGLPLTVNCSGGTVSIPIALPSNSDSTPETYLFSLSIKGASSSTETTAVSVDGTGSGHIEDVSSIPSGVTTWSPQQATAYVIVGSLSVPGNATLTIKPGTVIKSIGDGSTCDNLPANICVLGTLDAVGTPAQPIIFTSFNDPVGGDTGNGNPQLGDWAGITISRNSGSAYPPASVDLENAVVEYSGGFGSGAGTILDAPNPTLTNDSVENVTGVAYDLNSEGPFNNISGVDASGNGSPVLDLSGGSLDTTTLQAEPIPWETSGGILVLGGQTLTIEPGAVIKSFGGGPSTRCDNLPANICVSGDARRGRDKHPADHLHVHERSGWPAAR